jgi:hypothetical protein
MFMTGQHASGVLWRLPRRPNRLLLYDVGCTAIGPCLAIQSPQTLRLPHQMGSAITVRVQATPVGQKYITYTKVHLDASVGSSDD